MSTHALIRGLAPLALLIGAGAIAATAVCVRSHIHACVLKEQASAI